MHHKRTAPTEVGAIQHPQCTPDDHHAVWLCGYEHGKQERVQLEISEAVRGALHQMACDQIGLARQAATDRHGIAWANAITEAGEIQ